MEWNGMEWKEIATPLKFALLKFYFVVANNLGVRKKDNYLSRN